MPTTLGERYSTTWSGYPARMSEEDFEIWKLYRPQIQGEAVAMYFDVGLGGQTDTPPETDPDIARMWLRNTQKRADVILDAGDSWVIIELRAEASASAIGRLLMYKELWNQDRPDHREVKLRLVTNREDLDVKALSKIQGIGYVVV